MKKFLKHGIAQVFAQIGICTVMCGAMIGILILSGSLLFLAKEGRNKIFLIPALVLLALVVYLYDRNKKMHKKRGCSTTGGKMCGMMLFMTISLLIAMIFMIYIFIPWWIPDYNGGFLLP